MCPGGNASCCTTYMRTPERFLSPTVALAVTFLATRSCPPRVRQSARKYLESHTCIVSHHKPCGAPNPLTWRWVTHRRPSFSMHDSTSVTQSSYTTPTRPILNIGHQQERRSSVHRYFGKARSRLPLILLGWNSQQLWESFLPASIRSHSGVKSPIAPSVPRL